MLSCANSKSNLEIRFFKKIKLENSRKFNKQNIKRISNEISLRLQQNKYHTMYALH